MRRWLLFLALAACAAPKQGSAPQTDSYIVTAKRTLFYSFGPAQAQGPDFSLPKGSPVTMVHREFGFSQVRTAKGEVGYVANDTIAPAPPPPPIEPAAAIAGSKHHQTNGNSASLSHEKLNVVPLDQMFEEPALPTR